jgi:non-specific serine/threonine protein kinase
VALGVSPTGRLFIRQAEDDEEGLTGPAAARVSEAFARGAGHGLLHLALAEGKAVLPPDLGHARDLARAFMSRLCTVVDLDAKDTQVAVPPPSEGFATWLEGAPPILGAEYLSAEVAAELWHETEGVLQAELRTHGGTLAALLEARGSAFCLVGRVCLHLAENKEEPHAPFAFLATYTTKLSRQGKAQHAPLGRALTEYAGAKDKAALLSLLRPVQRAAERSALMRELLESGELYHPLKWTARDAYRFLQEVPALEASGLVVRVPDWWRARRTTRPEVRVSVGGRAGPTLGADTLLDFSVELSLDGEALTDAEWKRLLASTEGLVLMKGRWVEVDAEKLAAVLAHWKAVERAARQGVPFHEGMRLLAGVTLREEGGKGPAVDVADWSRVTAGDGLRRTLEELARPDARSAGVVPGLEASLRPYQQAGVAWLALLTRLGLGACLADDMGLGKTIQVLSLLLQRKAAADRRPSLLVVPASLLGNWKAEAARFAPGLRLLVAHPSERPAADLAKLAEKELAAIDLVVTSYGTVQRLPWATETAWDLVILDEAQAIKNPGAKQSRAVKALRGRARVALTGTPVENRLGDLWSIFDFVCPGLLGTAGEFGKLVKRLAASEAPSRYVPLRRLVQPYVLRRLKTDRTVIADLPDKTEVRAYCALSKAQAALYAQTVDALERDLKQKSDDIARRGKILAYLLRFKQICNHPSQWTGDGAWDPADSGKLARLAQLCEPIAARQEKVLVFTQFRETTEPLARFLAGVFGRSGLVLTGETKVKDRRALVERFQDEQGPPFFVLSLKAGGTGLNLTAASHVIHFDRWWNPAVEDQATDRAYRIGQRRNVLVHKFVCRGTVEERIDALVEGKRELAGAVVEGGGEPALTELDDAELLRVVALDLRAALDEA